MSSSAFKPSRPDLADVVDDLKRRVRSLEALAPATSIGSMTEIDYVERTTDAPTPGTILVGSSFTVVDPADIYLVHFYSPDVQTDAAGVLQVHLELDGTDVGLIYISSYISLSEVQLSAFGARRMTGLSAGSHEFAVYSTMAGAGPITVKAGSGVGSDLAPCYLQTFRIIP